MSTTPSAGSPPPAPGARVTLAGRYELLLPLGHGGMGEVSLARLRGASGFRKLVAVKRVHAHLAKEPEFIDMFLDEARLAAAVHHPNVAQVFDLGTDGGAPLLAMEYLHGEHLGVVAPPERPPLPPLIAARIVALAAEGLHAAHEARSDQGTPLALVHRDVSPQNVFVTYDGQVKVTDFGVARAEGRLAGTHSGRIKGKTAYLAPEQVVGDEVDRRADIFALGIVAWELLAGRRLFRAGSDAETLLRIAQHEEAPPLGRAVPQALAVVVERALARRPDDRFETAREMSRALEQVLAAEGEVVGAAEIAAMMSERCASRREAREALVASALASPADDRDSDLVPTLIAPAVARTRPRRLAVVFGIAIAAVAGLIAVIAGDGTSTGEARARVRIDSRPSGASVLLDGVAVDGATPLIVSAVPEGRHRVVLRLAGHRTHEGTFDVDRDSVELTYQLEPESDPRLARETAPALPPPEPRAPEPVVPRVVPTEPGARPDGAESRVRRAAVLPPASLDLLSRPWATVRIDGADVGHTPLIRHALAPGRRVIELRARGEGEPRRLVLDAEPGAEIARSVDFTEPATD